MSKKKTMSNSGKRKQEKGMDTNEKHLFKRSHHESSRL